MGETKGFVCGGRVPFRRNALQGRVCCCSRSEISHPCRNGTKGLGGCVQRAFLQGVAGKFGNHLTLMEIFSNVQNQHYCQLCITVIWGNRFSLFVSYDVSKCENRYQCVQEDYVSRLKNFFGLVNFEWCGQNKVGNIGNILVLWRGLWRYFTV